MSISIIPVTSDKVIDIQVDGTRILFINTNTSSSVTITLPDCSQNEAIEYYFFNNSGNNALTFTVAPAAGQHFAAANSVVLLYGSSLRLISYGSMWFTIDSQPGPSSSGSTP